MTEESKPDLPSDSPDTRLLLQTPTFTFPAQIRNVIDGDTVDVFFDHGFDRYAVERVRLRDIDTREISFVDHESEEYQRGMAHKEYVQAWVDDSQTETEWPFILYSAQYNRGAYGRVIGDLYSLNRDEWLTRALYHEFDDVEVYE